MTGLLGGWFPLTRQPGDPDPPPYLPPRPQVAIYGDSFTTGTPYGGWGAQGWPALLADRLRVETVNMAVGGTGFVRVDHASTFPHAAAVWPVWDAACTVVFGGTNDRGQDPVAVGLAVTVLCTLLRARSDGPLIVAAPQWPATPVPAYMYAIRDAIRDAALAAGAAYLDPLSWLTGRGDLIGEDGLHPTDGGHRLLADRLTPAVAGALAARPAPSGTMCA